LPRKNTTVKTYDVINGSLQKAEDFGYIKHNPCKAVKRPTYKKQKRRAFELWEQSKIIENLSPLYARLFIFLCCTGLRIGEFRALTEDSIDWQKHVIHVTNAINSRTGTFSTTKTINSVRNVIFESSLFDNFNLSDYNNISYNAIKKALEKVYHKLGIKDISVTHSCRHTYASIMHALGVSDKILQRQMGHASITTTMDTYADILTSGTSPILDYCRKLKAEIERHLL
jgi:integrase